MVFIIICFFLVYCSSHYRSSVSLEEFTLTSKIKKNYYVLIDVLGGSDNSKR